MNNVVTIKGEQYDVAKHSNDDALAVYDLSMKLHMLSMSMHEKNITIRDIHVWFSLRCAMDDLKKMLAMEPKITQDNANVIEIF